MPAADNRVVSRLRVLSLTISRVMSAKKPFEIAREALIMLAGRKLAPTPDNYLSVFNEIAGTPHAKPFPGDEMRRLLDALPLRQVHRTQFERAVADADWNGKIGRAHV